MADARSLPPPNDDRALVRALRDLAGPAIATSVLHTAVFAVDRAVLGHAAGPCLAAMQVAGPLEWSIVSVFSAFTVATIARAGFHLGAGQGPRARAVVRLSFVASLVAGVVVACAGLFLARHLRGLSPAASEAVLANARAYLEPTLLLAPAQFLALTSLTVLQVHGDTRTPFLVGLATNAVHLVLVWAMALGHLGFEARGCAGAGLGTALTFVAEALLLVGIVARRGLLRGASAIRPEQQAFWSVAIPTFGERTLYHAGYVLFVAVIGRMGDVVMAANQALLTMEAMCWLSADGFGISAASLAARLIGAGRVQDARRCAVLAAKDAARVLVTVGVVAWTQGGVLLPLVSADPAVVAEGKRTLVILLLVQPFMAMGTVFGDTLRGIGETKAVFAISTLSALVVRVGATTFFGITLGLGLPGVWLGSTTDWIVRTVAYLTAGRRVWARLAREAQGAEAARGHGLHAAAHVP
jgi:putative MATE family efflux protein